MKSSLANAVGGKTARACDSCVKRRARWYCAADDAFLCQVCDGLVHSANPLARRHERVRLKSSTTTPTTRKHHSSAATWHQGFTRKARTPRGTKKNHLSNIFHDLVPEISVEDQTTDSYELEDQLMICQVPVLDPTVENQSLNEAIEPKIEFCMPQEDDDHAESCLNGFFPTDIELEEFAADVETLLGGGLDTHDHHQAYVMEELGLSNGNSSNSEMFKVEKEEEEEEEMGICEDGTVPFELSFDYESQKMNEEEVMIKNVVKEEEEQKSVKMLRLNYDAVITMWGTQGPPWTAGDPPELDLDIDGWPMTSPMEGISNEKQYVSGLGLNSGGFGDGGREARVSRYREKRRTRLFSKKIRYEVRKLNAEKRPRMKGRFVKRTSLTVPTTSNSPLAINF